MGSVVLTCVQCNRDFEPTAREQEQADDLGFNLPKRCPECRKRKAKVEADYHQRKFGNKKKHYRLKYED